MSGWQSGSRAGRFERGFLSLKQPGQENKVIVTQQPSTSTTKLEEGIVGVDGTSHQALNR